MRDAGAAQGGSIRTEDAHLVVNHCRFRVDPKLGPAEKNGGNLIVFPCAPTTRPLPDNPWPFDKPFDKPVCLIIDSVLITPGDVLAADVGRGIIALTQCAVAGGNAFLLAPAKVARSRFDADLSLERCTVAAEKSFVTLGPWPGAAPGPERPWLVTSRDTAFMASYTPPSRESVLLKVEPNSLAQGALFWRAVSTTPTRGPELHGAGRQARAPERPSRRSPPVGQRLGDEPLPQCGRTDSPGRQRLSPAQPTPARQRHPWRAGARSRRPQPAR